MAGWRIVAQSPPRVRTVAPTHRPRRPSGPLSVHGWQREQNRGIVSESLGRIRSTCGDNKKKFRRGKMGPVTRANPRGPVGERPYLSTRLRLLLPALVTTFISLMYSDSLFFKIGTREGKERRKRNQEVDKDAPNPFAFLISRSKPAALLALKRHRVNSAAHSPAVYYVLLKTPLYAAAPRFNFRSGLRDMIHAHVKDLPRVLVNSLSSKAPATPKRASVKGNKKVRRE